MRVMQIEGRVRNPPFARVLKNTKNMAMFKFTEKWKTKSDENRQFDVLFN